MIRKISKQNILRLIDELLKRYEIIAPVPKENKYVFDKINSAEDCALEYDTTILGLKKFLLPPAETLIKFKNSEIIPADENHKLRIFFGIHPCDLNGLIILDKVEYGEYKDPYYIKRRENIITIVLECSKAYEHCFCESLGMDKPKNFDILLTALGKYYLVETGSEKGAELVNRYNKFFKSAKHEEKKVVKKKFVKKIATQNLAQILNEKINYPYWEELGEKCLSCRICTNVCPTCYCYSVKDFVELSLKEGRRERYWDSCLGVDFARVAGGLNFRLKRSSRLVQRVYHKFLYFPEQYGDFACTGCGRCELQCPADIKLTEILEKLRGS